MNKRYDNLSYKPAWEDRNGFLHAVVPIARVGVYDYLEDEKVVKEFRDPAEVFSKDSIESIKMMPVTLDHPDDFVTPENAKELQVGSVGEDIFIDGNWIMAPIVVTAKEAIESIKSGKDAVSLGYSAEINDIAGEYMGEKFDRRQTEIRANHLALVDAGRAGEEARIRFDSYDDKKTRKDNMEKITINGVDYEVPPEVKVYLVELEGKANNAEELEAKADKIQAEKDELEKSSVEKLNQMEKMFDSRFEARLQLIEDAKKIIPDYDYKGKSDEQIRKDCITARYDSVDLKDKSTEYITARFDAMLESLEAETALGQRATIAGRKDSKRKMSKFDEAFASIMNQWKGGEK